ncbi:carboxylesterase/lipase family protein [Dyadobacter frigoris]|uniref:Carboxylic ester hydrolase n=1 Tax=Dyadobacter frigoris TaxID=2576211 RepID=A0A4U6D3F1_9BACT|nr:carboxylesterase family protein [Dyadobacter frigoris]TKT90717.1 carboxylesterase family protein [Dyadobacter frigoris]GLU52046.1 carboxylic ester hydrolase [Dyadobacter frigoris]
MKTIFITMLLALQIMQVATAQSKKATSAPQAKTVNGTVEGVIGSTGVRAFKGIPFAAPPVGEFRWREPQPVKDWQGVRKTDKFGPRAMQNPVFGDMGFRSDGMSEDCLYLNVWTPAKSASEKLPVLVYFYGGGFVAGDGSEGRYDGESMATKGIVSLTVNYRLGVFGFYASEDLTKESPHHASGNYGYLDQAASLAWVKQNIAAFGGDPDRVTIAGESAGSLSVSALMASPLSKNLFSAAIGESGSVLGTLPPVPLVQAEQAGAKFNEQVGKKTLAEMRAISAEELLKATANAGVSRFLSAVDGYFFPESPLKIFQAGKQSQVPLLAGWNSEEMNYRMILGKETPTLDNYTKAVQKLYGEQADKVLKEYPASSDAEVEQVATDLAGDRFIGFGTWKWIDIQSKTGGGKPVYRYLYGRPRPAMNAEMGNISANLAGGVSKNAESSAVKAPLPKGAVHSAEIEYAMGNLSLNKVYAWTPEDHKVSATMQEYFANFVKKANPNGKGLPEWLPVKGEGDAHYMYLDVNSRLETDKHKGRYILMDAMTTKD